MIYPRNLVKEDLPSGYGITLKGYDRVIGSIDFNHRHGDKVLEIGYLLHPDFWGCGLMLEAARAMLQVGFDILNLDKILLICFDSNRQSQHVAEKLGFRLEKTLSTIDFHDQPYQDLVYGLMREAWRIYKRYVLKK